MAQRNLVTFADNKLWMGNITNS